MSRNKTTPEAKLEIGAFPYLIKKGKLKIMIVTNCAGNTWILPKGHPETNLQDTQVALLEATEEAGIKGKLLGRNSYKEFKGKGGRVLRIYPLAIGKVLTEWPEEKFRKRQLVSVEQALSLVTRQAHMNAIVYFSKPAWLKKLA